MSITVEVELKDFLIQINQKLDGKALRESRVCQSRDFSRFNCNDFRRFG